ncbi:hypothetical protein HDEF_1552 [Candidatus Hamiltonella defensa 5AT (Acyrthosiphon pisum)]|uniref:Uncharacterized protein n=1 Tax=Hamiltonella defensa subsp. Acyrthosiphon pisum (strain 5AT) TaxID=572265 RepID=C4K6H7_HAMD5|nr:hypothetical protein HDEF_1552 [Candidatus Hamiltonella defensa 5AT (Acyrthosiphon pisum)]
MLNHIENVGFYPTLIVFCCLYFNQKIVYIFDFK